MTLPTYNEANLLEQMAVRLQDADQTTPFVADIDYNARGQRKQIIYATTDGTNFTTTYDYDSDTFRLTRLHTVRHRDNRDLQDLNYAYDPVGNITSIRDNAQQTVFFSNTQVEPHNDCTYDALYRLIRAEGREHAAQNNFQRDATEFTPIIGIPFPNSPEALQRYVEEYAYDGVGNILSMSHIGGAVERWTRRYQYAEDSNRLQATSLPGDGANEFSAPYTYDAHGNMTTMPHLPLMQWDFRDQLQATSRQVVNEGTPETTYYAYDAAGLRVRKVTERQAAEEQTPTRRNERLYVGGFEVYREYNGDGSTVTLERETLHVMDDQQRIAQIDTRTQGNDDAPTQSRHFQLSNHLGSAVLEIDDQANIISYEEYHPYGTSAYRAGRSAAEVSLKRYRYTGKEKDEETGLYYHGARYYAPWLGRWSATDPAGPIYGLNLYKYVLNNPMVYRDATGLAPTKEKGFLSSLAKSAQKTLGKSVRAMQIAIIAAQTGALGVEGVPDTPTPRVSPGPKMDDPSAAEADRSGKGARTVGAAGAGPPGPKKEAPFRFDPPSRQGTVGADLPNVDGLSADNNATILTPKEKILQPPVLTGRSPAGTPDPAAGGGQFESDRGVDLIEPDNPKLKPSTSKGTAKVAKLKTGTVVSNLVVAGVVGVTVGLYSGNARAGVVAAYEMANPAANTTRALFNGADWHEVVEAVKQDVYENTVALPVEAAKARVELVEEHKERGVYDEYNPALNPAFNPKF